MLQPMQAFRRLWIAGLAVLVACAEEPVRQGGSDVLLVGVDGLDPVVVGELIAEGRLPNLTRFANEGVLGALETQRPTFSPVLWTTIATGQGAAEHGVVDFIEARSGMPFTSESRQVPALWNLVSDAGLRVDVAGWWVTWPAEPVNGRLAASYAAQAQAHVLWKSAYVSDYEGQTFPPRLFDELRPLITFASEPAPLLEELWRSFPKPDDQSPLTRRLVTDLAWTLSADRSFEAIGRHFLANDPGELVLVYLSLPDVAGHRFWRYHRPADFPYAVPERELARFGDYLRIAYEDVDRALGRLMEAAGDDRAVLLVSDHGMTFDPEGRTDPDAITSGHHRSGEPGLFGALGAPFAHRAYEPGSRRALGNILGVAPLVLRLLGLERPDHWPAVRHGNGLEELLDPTWAAAQPARAGPHSDATWRARNPRRAPRAPSEEANELFLDALHGLGYLGGEPETAPNDEPSDEPNDEPNDSGAQR